MGVDIIYNIAVPITIIIIGYIFGSIPSGVWIGKLFFNEDPRNSGSHNSGGTNASRLWGIKYGLLVYLADFLKLAVPLWATWAFFTFVPFNGKPLIPPFEYLVSHNVADYIIKYPAYWLIIPGAVIGHCYPVFASFKGGKAAAVTYSSCFFGSWFTLVSSMSSFLLTLGIKKYVSLASIIGTFIGVVASWLTCIPGFGQIAMYGATLAPGITFASCLTFAWLILVYRHRANIKRIFEGNERKVHLGKK